MAKTTKSSVKAAKSETSTEKKVKTETKKSVKTEKKSKVEPKTTKTETKKTTKVETKRKQLVKAMLMETKVITESSDEAREFYNQSRFGVIGDSGKVELSLLEALFLFDKGKLELRGETGRKLSFESYIKKAKKIEPNFLIRYCVFKDMRNRGYVVKTALKFGADFRVYDRGVKPGEDHARWIVYPVHEGSVFTWYEFAAKNRVAHSTKKRLLMGIVDDEGDVTYYEMKWMRP